MDVQVGQRMNWYHQVSEWGHTNIIPVTVLKIGKRVTVQTDGGYKTVVTRERLAPLPSADRQK